MVNMSRAELLAVLDEITAILESPGQASEKLERIEEAMFEPVERGEEREDDDDDVELGEDEREVGGGHDFRSTYA